MAEKVEKLNAVCRFCSEVEAPFTLRTVRCEKVGSLLSSREMSVGSLGGKFRVFNVII